LITRPAGLVTPSACALLSQAIAGQPDRPADSEKPNTHLENPQ
jgi:hypothetical protein